MHEHDNPSLFTIHSFAREMRRSPTRSEMLLWRHVCQKQLGVRVRRQHVLYPFIVDFYVPAYRLVIEVDGGVHDVDGVRERDSARANALVHFYDVRVLRIEAALVEHDTCAAVALVRGAMRER
jgi:very-short-patch-repair endonuclease